MGVSGPSASSWAARPAAASAGFTRASLEFLDDGELLELGSGTHWVTAEEPERIGKILVDFFSRAAEGTAAGLIRPNGP